MVYLGILLGIGIMAAMVYLALNKKSTFSIRIASIAALFLMILTIIICLFVALTDNTVPVDESILIVGAPPATQERNTANVMVLSLLIVFLIAIFVTIALLAMHEHRKYFPKKKGNQ